MKRNSDENELGPPFRAVMLSMLIIFVCATAFCGCVSADGGETSQGVSTWDDLKSKLEDSTTNVVTLGDDITVSDKENDALSITISGNKELNLNGHTINTIPSDTAKTTYNLFIINGDDTSLNITGNGNIINSNTVIKLLHGSVCLDSGNFTIKKGEGFEPPFVQIRGCSTDVESYSNFKLGEKATIITNEDCWGVAMFSHDAKKGNGYGIVADIYGTINGDGGGITPNGVLQPEDLTSQNLPKITIHKGAVINTKQAAVYGAGYGIWTFEEGCNVTGSDALGIKSGKFTIKGGKFTGNGDYCEYPAAWSNGMNEVGAAIQVQSNDDYAGNVELIINGGTFTSVNNSALVSTMPVPTTGANAGKVPKNVFKDITIDTSTTTFNFAEGMKNVDIRVCVDSINNLTTAFESGYNVSLEKDITMKVDDSFTIPVNNNLNISSEDHIITTSNGGVLQGWSTTVRKQTDEKSIEDVLSTGKYYPVSQFNITYINTSASTSKTSQIIFGEQNSLKKNTFTNATAEFGGWAETPEGAVKYADEASFTLT
ncbi:MAG TPA: hypothetical protein O0W90_00245, partial [Methanocorpusculum sp.]|nr:hypothetical protein [Methanocorpusculum sp.]